MLYVPLDLLKDFEISPLLSVESNNVGEVYALFIPEGGILVVKKLGS